MYIIIVMLTLVIYDISSDRKRDKLVKYLEKHGLDRVQYSGFVGELNPNDRAILAKEAKKFITPLEKKIKKKEKEKGDALSEKELRRMNPDSIYVIPLCQRCANICRIVSDQDISLMKEDEVTIIG